ncbi:uncharacterized protein N0V89_002133 [Didymosphaeria variabile]|uniref:Uncharacterized protein n=1 Tax=Didymosphaeria variabile TaxID=1932322 RepID=A0A9W8XU80_9PLEO|nr:uncharacterized protein N0V89_002133 [Didymosphaeria variabile]KAJ4357557.1 hypothetical protein N0V89_002133 [Didymosphaeria variabile]
MPIDRTNNNTSRPPLKPTLATTRTSKTPVAPRLAPSVTSTPASRTTRSAVGSTPRVNTAVYEDVTPVKAFISSNVTPRSSSRKSRVGTGSANSTPSGTPATTPVVSRPASTVDFPQKDYGHVGNAPNALGGVQRRPKSTVGANGHNVTSMPRLPLSNIYSNAPEAPGARGASASPMFFHANEARTTPEPQQPPQKKAPVFFYANGKQDASAPSPTVPSPPLSAVGRMQTESKFFHADSLSDTRDSPPVLTPPPMSASPEPWSSLHPADSQHSLRPPSPSKENIHLSYRRGASQVIRPNLHTRNSALSIISGSHGPEVGADTSTRRSSVTSAVRFSHAKSASLSSIDSVQSLKKVPSLDQPHITPSPLHNEKRVVSTGSLPESVASVPAEALSSLPSSNAVSPTKLGPAGKSMLEHMNELAANARRERKVLDLEISNNSLMAINRSLEREMRKQKAELRRFRRMSRAGRFSADTVSNLEEFSAVGVAELGDLSDMSEEEEPEEAESEEHSDSSFDESIMSEGALAERDEAHRIRDERRLRLDLSKHRELLADSAKMNQSLKRCLNWTEELIKDGQKALAYQVRVSDVQLGGRVLSSEEQPEADQVEESHGLLSPWSPPHRETNPMDGSPPLHPDRDSGIDLDGIKSAISGLESFISPLASPL